MTVAVVVGSGLDLEGGYWRGVDRDGEGVRCVGEKRGCGVRGSRVPDDVGERDVSGRKEPKA